MRWATETEIRASFINCSKGEAKRLVMPSGLASRPWAELDFLGWSDPGAPERNYLVTARESGLVGIVLRAASRQGVRRPGLCSFCLTPHPAGGVRLMTAPKAGAAGRQGNSVGTLLCADLCCSLYVRGRKQPASGGRLSESLTLDDQIARTVGNLHAFLDSLTT